MNDSDKLYDDSDRQSSSSEFDAEGQCSATPELQTDAATLSSDRTVTGVMWSHINSVRAMTETAYAPVTKSNSQKSDTTKLGQGSGSQQGL